MKICVCTDCPRQRRASKIEGLGTKIALYYTSVYYGWIEMLLIQDSTIFYYFFLSLTYIFISRQATFTFFISMFRALCNFLVVEGEMQVVLLLYSIFVVIYHSHDTYTVTSSLRRNKINILLVFFLALQLLTTLRFFYASLPLIFILFFVRFNTYLLSFWTFFSHLVRGLPALLLSYDRLRNTFVFFILCKYPNHLILAAHNPFSSNFHDHRAYFLCYLANYALLNF